MTPEELDQAGLLAAARAYHANEAGGRVRRLRAAIRAYLTATKPPTPDEVGAVVGKLKHLVSLNRPENGGPYQGIAAQACVEAMISAADLITTLSAQVASLTRERDEARRVAEATEVTQRGLWQDITELRASLESLRAAKDVMFRNGEAWEARATATESSLAACRAALERIRSELYTEWGTADDFSNRLMEVARAALHRTGAGNGE